MSVIELCGMPRAGKTTQRRGLEEYLTSIGKSYRTVQRPDVSFKEVGSLERFHDLYLENIERALRQRDVDMLIFDRGPYDRGVFLTLDYAEGHITKEFVRSCEERLAQMRNQVDCAYLLLVTPEESYRRWPSQINEGLDNQHLNVGMPSYDESMRLMRKKHEAYVELSKRPDVVTVDCMAPKEEVRAQILNSLRRRGLL